MILILYVNGEPDFALHQTATRNTGFYSAWETSKNQWPEHLTPYNTTVPHGQTRDLTELGAVCTQQRNDPKSSMY